MNGGVERRAAVDRALGWYLHTLLDIRDVVCPGGPPVPGVGTPPEGVAPLRLETHEQALQWLDAEYVNLLAATHHALASGRLRTAQQLVRGLWFVVIGWPRGAAGPGLNLGNLDRTLVPS